MSGEIDWTGFGARVRATREAKGMNQAALAELIGVAPGDLSNVENATGKWRPRPEKRLFIAEQLGVSRKFLEEYHVQTPADSAMMALIERKAGREEATAAMANVIAEIRGAATLPSLVAKGTVKLGPEPDRVAVTADVLAEEQAPALEAKPPKKKTSGNRGK